MTVRNAASAVDRTSSRESDSGSLGEGGTAAPLGVLFDALLSAQRISLRGSSSRGRASASQMFEPAASGAREHRRTTMAAEDRADRLARSQPERMDTTSVRARSAKQGAGAGDCVAKESSELSGRGNLSREASRSKLGTAGTGSSLQSSNPAALRGDATASSSSDVLGSVASRSDAGTRGSREPAMMGLQTAAAVPQMVSTGAAERVGTNGRADGAVARHVAEILSSGRIAEPESARAAGLPAAGDSREASAERKSAQEAAGRQTSGETNSKAAGGGAKTAPTEFDELIRAIRLRGGTRNSSARLYLEPPELGRVQIDVRMSGDDIRIAVRAETVEARKLLTQRASALTTALERSGINVEQLDVVVDSDPKGEAGVSERENADVAGGSGSEQRSPAEVRSSDRVPDDRVEQLVGMESDSSPAVVAETRLDIRA